MIKNSPALLVAFLCLTLLVGGCSTLEKWVKAPERTKELFQVSWTKNFDVSYETGNLPIALGSPFAFDGIVYVGDGDGVMHAFNLSDGRSLWEHKENTALGPKPGVYKDQVIYGSWSGRVFSRHYLTGELKYSVDLDSTVESAPVFHEGRLFFHLRNHKIVSLDAETGKILWAYRRSVPSTTTIQRVSEPRVFQDKLYVGFADGFMAAFNLEDGVLLWEQRLATGTKFVDVDTTPVFKDGFLLAGSLAGNVSVIDPKTGTILRTLPYTISRAPLIIGKDLYLGTTTGHLVKLNSQFDPVAEKKLSKSQLSSMVKWNDYLAVGTTGPEIFLVDPTTLEQKGSFYMGSRYSAIMGDMQSMSDRLVALSSRYRLYVFH